MDKGWRGYIWDRTAIKVAITAGVAALFALTAAISAYNFHLNSLKRHDLEATVSSIMGVRVSIGSLSWRPEDNRLILGSVRVANPPGFDSQRAMTIMAIYMKVDSESPSSATLGEVVVFRAIVYLNIRNDTTNLTVIHANMSRTVPVAAPDGKPFMVVIKNVRSNYLVLNASVSPPDRMFTTRDMEDLHMTGLGEKENGLPVAQAVARVIDAILSNSFVTAAQEGALQELSKQGVQDILDSGLEMPPDFANRALNGEFVTGVSSKHLTPAEMRRPNFQEK